MIAASRLPTSAGPARDASAAGSRREHQLARLKVATEGDQDQPVGWQEIGPLDLATQNGDFVPMRQNLNLQLFGRATVEFDAAHDQQNDRIDGRAEHERRPYSSARPVVVAKQPEVPSSQADMLRAAGREWNRNGFCAHPTPSDRQVRIR